MTMLRLRSLVLCLVLPAGAALTHSSSSTHVDSKLNEQNSQRSRHSTGTPRRRKRYNVCEEPEGNSELDRREAVFAMLGNLWALTSVPVHARYGEDAKNDCLMWWKTLTNETSRRESWESRMSSVFRSCKQTLPETR